MLSSLLARLRSFFSHFATPKFPLTQLALGTKPKPLPILTLPERNKLQTPNNSTVSRYEGVTERLLLETNCVELSQITTEHLRAWANKHKATPFQLSRLLGLWTGHSEVSPQLHAMLVEIAWPAEKEKLLKFLGGKFDTATRDRLIEQMAWR